MSHERHDEIRQAVRRRYAQIADGEACGCAPGCCDGTAADAAQAARALGYSTDETAQAPDGANLGLGCGNPLAIAGLAPGETVLDLGSGAGFDCFLAARQVGEHGRVIGVDMTPAMFDNARRNADRGGYRNVEFRLGEIESLPVADGVVDVILSNCVINLSPNKARVFAEAFRVLKSGGRLAISDVVAFADLPDALKRDPELLTGCIAGASPIAELEALLRAAGFTQIRIRPQDESRAVLRDWAPGTPVTDYVVSASIEAVKPGADAAAPPSIRQAVAGDLPAIRALLARCRLPGEDLDETRLRGFRVASANGEIVGVCAVEVFGGNGLLRSLAVAPAQRGRHLGAHLVAACEAAARAAGLGRLFLLTTSARDMLRRLGYADIDRAAVPAAVRAHPQFLGLCPASAHCLAKRLR